MSRTVSNFFMRGQYTSNDTYSRVPGLPSAYRMTRKRSPDAFDVMVVAMILIVAYAELRGQ